MIIDQTESYGDGIKFLTVLTCIWYSFALYYLLLKKYIVKPFFIHVVSRISMLVQSHTILKRYHKAMIWILLVTAAIVYCILITAGNRYRLVSGIGLLGFLLFGYLMSEHKRRINWNQVLWGLAMQFCLALLVLRSNFGKQLFNTVGDKISAFLMFTDTGSAFLFGYLVTGQLDGVPNQMSVFAFKVRTLITPDARVDHLAAEIINPRHSPPFPSSHPCVSRCCLSSCSSVSLFQSSTTTESCKWWSRRRAGCCRH